LSDLESLKRTAQKPVDTIAARILVRPVSIRITSLLIKTRVEPTQVTLLSFGIRIVASIMFIFSEYPLTLGAGIFVYLSEVFDCVDGELARAKKLETHSGAILDYFLDRISEILIYSTITLALFASENDYRTLLVGFLAVTSQLFRSDIGQQVDALKEQSGAQPAQLGIKSYCYYGDSEELMILVTASILNRLLEGMIIIGICSFSYGVARFAEAYLTFRKKRTLAR
jgi:phosphatidylglycerophosphate synthase